MFRTLADTIRSYALWLEATMPLRRRVRDHAWQDRTGVLLLAWSLPPMIAGGTYRPLAFLRFAAQNAWNMTAVTQTSSATHDQAGDYLRAQLPRTTRIIRIAPSDLRPSWRWFPRIDGGFVTALQTVKVICAEPVPAPAAIVASGPPFHTFVAAYYLSRVLKARLILDYRDEWSECPFDFVNCGSSDIYWEKRCLRAADGVIFTTASMCRNTIARLGPIPNDRAFIVQNGWEPLNFAHAQNLVRADPERLTFSFVGNLGNHTPPKNFLSDMASAVCHNQQLERQVRIRFVGERSRLCDQQLKAFPYPAMLRIEPQVTQAEAAGAMMESDALLIFSNRDLARYIPGKLYEYVASGRPVIVHGEPGEASAIVEQLRIGCRVPQGDIAALLHAIDAVRQNQFETRSDQVRDWLDEHKRDTLSARFFDIVSAILRNDTQRLPEAYRTSSFAFENVY